MKPTQRKQTKGMMHHLTPAGGGELGPSKCPKSVGDYSERQRKVNGGTRFTSAKIELRKSLWSQPV